MKSRWHIPSPLPPFDRKALETAVALIRKARYSLVAVGLTMNRSHATGELREFVGKHRLPVVTTLIAKGQVPEEGSQLVGVLGRARREMVAAKLVEPGRPVGGHEKKALRGALSATGEPSST